MYPLSSRTDQADRFERVANERFKRSFSSWFWGSLTAATTLHFAIFVYLPSMAVADVGPDPDPAMVVITPPDLDIPPPPDAIRRPAQPVISAVVLDDVLPLPRNTVLDDVPPLPPPPDRADPDDISVSPGFVVHTVRPKMLNQDEVNRVLEREYPALLKDAGIGGTTAVHLFIDEGGIVRNQLVRESSGHAGLDSAALKVAAVARFSPAKNRDKPVALWIALDITFKAN